MVLNPFLQNSNDGEKQTKPHGKRKEESFLCMLWGMYEEAEEYTCLLNKYHHWLVIALFEAQRGL